jgi:hypothetical protein
MKPTKFKGKLLFVSPLNQQMWFQDRISVGTGQNTIFLQSFCSLFNDTISIKGPGVA